MGKKANVTKQDSKDVDSILEKYKKVRQRRNKSEKVWNGPSHQKFSHYFDGSSSESETENNPAGSGNEESEQSDSEKNKETVQSEVNRESALFESEKSEQSSTEPAASDSDGSLIMSPSKSKIIAGELPLPKFIEFSDSEPEDPEKVKILQEKLKARRSQVSNPNASVANRFQYKRTVNSTMNRSKFLPTRLSEVSPDLLNLSSSDDDNENVVPTFDRNHEIETYQTPEKKRKAADDVNSPPKRNPVANTISHSSPIVSPNKSSRSRQSSTSNKDSEPNSEQTSLLSNDLIDIDPVPETTPIANKLSKSASRVSRINVNEERSKLRKRSHANSTAVKRTSLKSSSDPLTSGRVPETTPIAKKLSKSAMKVSSKKIDPEQSASHGTPSKASALEVTFAVAEPTDKGDSIKKRLRMSTPKPKDLAPSKLLNKSKRVSNRFSKSKSSSVSVAAPDIEPIDPSPDHLNDANDPGNNQLVSQELTERKKSTDMPVAEHCTDIAIPSEIRNVENVTTSVKRTESSVETRNVVAGNEGPSRFMAGSRAALQDDPVQSFIVHQSATLFTTLWKLLPNMVNCARTRGPTCIIVFEGEIKIESQVYPRGEIVKLPSNTTYLVLNVANSAALFLVTEYL